MVVFGPIYPANYKKNIRKVLSWHIGCKEDQRLFATLKTFFSLNWLEFWTKFFEEKSGALQPLQTKPILLLQRDSGWKKENCHFSTES